MTDFRHRAAQLLHHREHLQCRDEAVTGGGIVRQDNVAGGLAAEIVAAAQHLFEHITIADRRAHQLQPQAFEETLKPEIRHHGLSLIHI